MFVINLNQICRLASIAEHTLCKWHLEELLLTQSKSLRIRHIKTLLRNFLVLSASALSIKKKKKRMNENWRSGIPSGKSI